MGHGKRKLIRRPVGQITRPDGAVVMVKSPTVWATIEGLQQNNSVLSNALKETAAKALEARADRDQLKRSFVELCENRWVRFLAGVGLVKLEIREESMKVVIQKGTSVGTTESASLPAIAR